MKKAISTNGAPAAIGPYSQAIDCGEFVFTSGQLGLDPATGKLVDGGVQAQATQAMKNILPALGNEFVVLIKETAVIGMIANIDLVGAARKVQSLTYDYLIPLLSIAVIYYVVIKIISTLLSKVEKGMRKADKR